MGGANGTPDRLTMKSDAAPEATGPGKEMLMAENQTYCRREDQAWATVISFHSLPAAEAEHCVCRVLGELREHSQGTASRNAVLDLANVRTIPSCLLGALVAFKRAVEKGGGILLLVNCAPETRELLRVCQLHRVLDLCHTMDEARQRLTTAPANGTLHNNEN